jgi:hypothetical protein
MALKRKFMHIILIVFDRAYMLTSASRLTEATIFAS